jgi:hypothetical protein
VERSGLRVVQRKDQSGEAPSVLVVRNTGLGDLMTGLPALRAVRRALPAHRLGTTCPSWLVPLARALDAADSSGASGGVHRPCAGGVLIDVPACTTIVTLSYSPVCVRMLRAPSVEVARQGIHAGGGTGRVPQGVRFAPILAVWTTGPRSALS